MAKWIDFRELREKLPFYELLRHFNIDLKITGERGKGFCPLPTHVSNGNGKPRSPSFSVHLGKGVFQCFGCGAKGNRTDLGARMLGMNPEDPAQLRKAAIQLAELFHIEFDGQMEKPRREKAVPRREPEATSNVAASSLEKVINAPIDFTLKTLDAEHPYLQQRGLTKETIEAFGLGYCGKGLLAGRIAIPIHDDKGVLLGYAGRLADDTQVDAVHSKYLFPPPRQREGKCYEFHKSLLVYNLHRQAPMVNDLVIVEGFPSVWWLHQAGIIKVVAVMGSSCSDAQARLVISRIAPEGRVWIMSDGDDAGRRLATELLTKIAPFRWTRWLRLDNGQQPTDLIPEHLRERLHR